jgi:hypothetical protein
MYLYLVSSSPVNLRFKSGKMEKNLIQLIRSKALPAIGMSYKLIPSVLEKISFTPRHFGYSSYMLNTINKQVLRLYSC